MSWKVQFFTNLIQKVKVLYSRFITKSQISQAVITADSWSNSKIQCLKILQYYLGPTNQRFIIQKSWHSEKYVHSCSGYWVGPAVACSVAWRWSACGSPQVLWRPRLLWQQPSVVAEWVWCLIHLLMTPQRFSLFLVVMSSLYLSFFFYLVFCNIRSIHQWFCVKHKWNQNAIICRQTVFTDSVLLSVPEGCRNILYTVMLDKVLNLTQSTRVNNWAFQSR